MTLKLYLAPHRADAPTGPAEVVWTDAQDEMWRFGVAPAAPKDALCAHPVTPPGDEFLLRIDTVTFPPGAVAWRHVHAGAGIRMLVAGRLRVAGDDHAQVMTPRDHWFEPADTPVKATPEAGDETTIFVRGMVVPMAYAGKPTIRILDAQDAAKPRLQVTERHADRAVTLADAARPQSG